MVHELKCDMGYYNHVVDGTKTFELRKNDRDYKVGDRLLLRETTPLGSYTGEACLVEVTYVLPGYNGVLVPGHCILAVKLIERWWKYEPKPAEK